MSKLVDFKFDSIDIDNNDLLSKILLLSRDYESIWVEDFVNNKIKVYQLSKSFLPNETDRVFNLDFQTRNNQFCELYVPVDERDEFNKIISKEYLKEYFKNNNQLVIKKQVLSDEYADDKWFELRVIKITDDPEDTTVVEGFKFFSNTNEESKTKDSLAKKEIWSVVRSLAEDFNVLLILNYHTDEDKVLRSDGKFEKYIPGWENIYNFNERIDLFINTLVYENDRDYVKKLADKKIILEYLSLNKAYFINFRIKVQDTIEHVQIKFILSPTDDDLIIVGFHNVDTEYQEKTIREKIINENKLHNIFLDSFYDMYESCFYVNIENNSLTIYKDNLNSQYISDVIDYDQYFENFIDEFIYDEDKSTFFKLVQIKYIQNNLKTKNHYFSLFRIKTNNRAHYYKLHFMKGNDNNTIAIGILDVNEEYHRELNEKEKLETLVANRTYELEERNNTLKSMSSEIIDLLGDIVESRDSESGEHIQRVKFYTNILAKQVKEDLPEYGLTDEKVQLITNASSLHDVGKISISDTILLKPGKLTKDEFEIMKSHSLKGCEIIKKMTEKWSEEYLETGMDICHYHHEKWDGKGYPEGLIGDNIPISAQIVSVADIFDALTSKRCYKDAYTADQAFEMIINGECGAFSNKILSCFKKCKDLFKKTISEGYSDMTHFKNDTLDSEYLKSNLQRDFIFECSKLLYSKKNCAAIFEDLLEKIGRFYDARKVYYIEINNDMPAQSVCYEWKDLLVMSEDSYRSFFNSAIFEEVEKYLANGPVYEENIKNLNSSQTFKDLLLMKRVKSVIASLVKINDDTNGILVIENPSSYQRDNFIVDFVSNLFIKGVYSKVYNQDFSNHIINQNQLYEKAILNEAISYFKIDVNTNEVISPIIFKKHKEAKDISNILGDELPTYDAILKIYCERFVDLAYQHNIINTLKSSNLLIQFKKKNYKVEVIGKIIKSNKDVELLRYVVYLSENITNHHINAMVLSYQITDSEKMIKETLKLKNEVTYLKTEIAEVLESSLYSLNIDALLKGTNTDTNTFKKIALSTLSRIVDEFPGGFCIYANNDNKDIIYANNFLINIFDCDSQEDFNQFIGNSYKNMIFKDDRKIVFQEIHNQVFINNEDFDHIQYRIQTKKGKIKWMKENGHFVHSEKIGDLYYLFLEDITDSYNIEQTEKELKNLKIIAKQKKKLENQQILLEEANQAKSTFLFNMSHDIRTPMNAILGYTTLALNDLEDTGKLKEYLSNIQLSGSLLMKMMNDILYMANLETGNNTSVKKHIDLIKLTEDIFMMFKFMTEEKNISFNIDVSSLNTVNVYADEVHINQILLNILNNSVQYTNDGGNINITISEAPSKKKNKVNIIFEIEDDGIGMSSEFLDHIFDSFSRENNTTMSGIEGTGLGMSIVNKLVDKLKGNINIKSKIDKGTKVTVSLPLDVKENIEEEDEIDIEEVKKRLIGKRILLVEDNNLNMEISYNILESNNFIVDKASNGKMAFDYMYNKGGDYYDFILMDIQMPVMDGYEAASMIRELKDCKKIPIIALSANAFDQDIKKSYDSGMNAHIIKPFNINDLFKELMRFF